MTTLAADEPRNYSLVPARRSAHYPMVASDIIYAGAAVTLDSNGDAKPLAGTDSIFAGFAAQQGDNSAGAAADKLLKVYTEGEVELPVVGVDDDDDVNSTVYATDDNTFTLTSTSAKAIGKVSEWISGTTCKVIFQGDPVRSL